MVKSLLTLALAFTSTSALAQSSLSIVALEREVWGNTTSSIIQSNAAVENISDQSISVKVSSEEISVVAGTLNYFCWAQCYEPGVTVSPTAVTIEPGQRIDSFYGDYKPQGQSGITTIKYCFFNVANEADSVCGIVRFNATPVGIQDVANSSTPGISDAFPNPAVGEMTFSYATGGGIGRLDIYSMLGSKVKSVRLPELSGKAKVNVESLTAGMYLYRLNVNGKDIQTRKLIISK
jgi:hypothetical protein